MKGFNNTRGEAQRGIDRLSFSDGENQFRIISGLRPRYVYWAKSADGATNIPLEKLSFNIEKEKFDNAEPDLVRELIPKFQEKDPKGRYKEGHKWAYCALVIDRQDGKVKLLDFKKTLFGEIQKIAKRRLGDPIDYESGWDVVALREKTGPRPMDVEYSLDQMACADAKGPLTDQDRQAIADFLDISVEEVTGPEVIDIMEYVERPTVEEQRKLIEEKVLGNVGSEEDSDEEEIPDEVAEGEKDDDVPF